MNKVLAIDNVVAVQSSTYGINKTGVGPR